MNRPFTEVVHYNRHESNRLITDNVVRCMLLCDDHQRILALEHLKNSDRALLCVYNPESGKLLTECRFNDGFSPTLLANCEDSSQVAIFCNGKVSIVDYSKNIWVKDELECQVEASRESPSKEKKSLWKILKGEFAPNYDPELIGDSVGSVLFAKSGSKLIIHGATKYWMNNAFSLIDVENWAHVGKAVRIDHPIPAIGRMKSGFNEQLIHGVYCGAVGQYITGDRNGWIFFWKLCESGFELSSTLRVPPITSYSDDDRTPPKYQIFSVAANNDTRIFAVGDTSGRIFIGNIDKPEFIHMGLIVAEENSHRVGVVSLRFFDGGEKLLSLHSSNICAVWNVKTGSIEAKYKFENCSDSISTNLIVTDASIVYAAPGYRSIIKLDLRSGKSTT